MNETDVTVQETPGVIAPEDALLLQESDAPKIPAVLLIDLSSIAHPIWHVSQAESRPGPHQPAHGGGRAEPGGESSAHGDLLRLKISFRKELDSTYKAQRPAQEAPLYHQIDLAKEALAADGFPVYEVDGFEGDDLIATATAQILDYLGPLSVHVLIASADKDLARARSVTALRSTAIAHGEATSAQKRSKTKLGVGPDLVVDYLTLVGDASRQYSKARRALGRKRRLILLNLFRPPGSGCTSPSTQAARADKLKLAQLASLKELRPRLEAVQAVGANENRRAARYRRGFSSRECRRW